jgi:predicted ATP-grasp superfamily ATP-dependent carboligase
MVRVLRSSFKESDIAVVEEKPVKTNKPILLTGFQDMGLIGVVAVSYVINGLKMEETGYLKSRFIPTVKVIVGSELRTVNSFRIYKNSTGDLLALLNDNPAGLIGMSPFFTDIGKTFADWFSKKDVRLVVALGSFLIQKDEKPSLVAYTMDSERMEELMKLGIKPLQQGVIGGFIVSIIDECIERKIPWLMLFAPSRKIGEVDNEGVLMIIEGINKMMGLNIEIPPLREVSESKGRSIRSLIRR